MATTFTSRLFKKCMLFQRVSVPGALSEALKYFCGLNIFYVNGVF